MPLCMRIDRKRKYFAYLDFAGIGIYERLAALFSAEEETVLLSQIEVMEQQEFLL